MRYKILVKFHKDFVEVSGDQITVGLKSKPIEGKANMELIRKIADHFDVPTSSVRIVSGMKSRSKTVEVTTDK